MCDPAIIPDRVNLRPNEWVDNTYKVVKMLGSGTFGDVYEVINEKNNVQYALKVLKLWAYDRRTRENLNKRFELEYQTGQIDSETLVKSNSYGCLSGNPYIVMEYCPFGTLRERIDNGMPLDEIHRYACDILAGLSVLHKHGKCHRDLKPENVLMDKDMRAKLTDFGIVGHANIVLTSMNLLGKPKDQLGTYLYMPSEQINPRSRKETILPTIDIFAFGVVCYEMFTRRYPFGTVASENDFAHYLKRVREGNWDDPTTYNRNIPPIWVEIIEKSLATNYKDRFQNVELILQRLGKQSIAPPVPVGPDSDWGLQVMQGEEYGKIYNLSELLGKRQQGILKMGWYDVSGSIRNDIAVKEEMSPYISRMHATIERTPEGWFIRDGQYGNRDGVLAWHQSVNHTYVNTLEVPASAGHLLDFDDIITIGNTTLKVIPINKTPNI